ncbi:MAG TPA: fumarylacetoacetate hydrolase family protein [Bryobacteraceae bacterium]|nr:fumarylacetoacetate hydrolase family protein [Bryobacteraceae bacterium]
MKLASFRADGRDRIGFLAEGATLMEIDGPSSILDLIESEAEVRTSHETFSIEDVIWHAPVRRPSKICCLALNNSANSDRILQGPKHPAMFIKPSSSLLGHRGAIECKPNYGRVHPEPELALVIGKTAKNIAAREAYDYVFGYTIHNDITSPTMRAEDTFHYRAIHPKAGDPKAIEYVDTWVSYPGRYKCCDTFACMGPWLVTKDEIDNPHNLAVSCSHQGQLVTEDNTENLFYKIPEVLEFLSRHLTLLPGDIVSMGTALKKSAQGGAVQNIDLNKLGGPVSVTIEKIGTLTNEVTHV